ncbi:39S ribosomal protein L33, mitochondrial isoform X4 [Nasonia vitripennis]|uniref:Uncharacterized protein n=1 Tax=Nasonia vitripennis TaxID=7425 RepID=A0A7M7QBI4_NASVI|nr:39S ribosomal protein L33, mitochondrial isoform X4 [Nasonia vitripennis]
MGTSYRQAISCGVFSTRDSNRDVLVLMESIASKHKLLVIRERLSEKLEFIRFDPYRMGKKG